MTVQLVDRDWHAAIRAGLGRDSSMLRVVCPFVKERVLAGLIKDHQPGEVRLITRLKLADFADGVSDIAALRAVLRAGGQVRGIRDLHAKVFLFGSTLAAVTSANLTTSGLAGNHEFGCISDEAAFVYTCSAYFDALWDAGSAGVTSPQLDDWEDLVGEHLDGGARPGAAAALPDFGAAVNLTAATLPDVAPPGWPAESGQAFVKFFGEGHNRADRVALTFAEVQRSGCHWACTYPAGKRPRAVQDGDTIFVGQLVAHPNDTLIFGRVIGRKHRAGQDDATPQDVAVRPFKEHWPHYIRVHHGRFVAGVLGNGVSLNELMDTLGTDAFTSTKANAAAGQGNTNPRKALSQQAHVRLSPEAAAWVTARLEEAFWLHGTVPAEALDQLDWP
ncbi:MAG TPA: phospholipase D family protein [Chloroflexota bacterium]|nr:phospholipase D family protein [Chloroflexota bacterium]